ncbi:glutathione S-transferase family protein [Neptunicella marina]|uniref:Glutathione S-transferase N-terminal domain-containing protein n=1 Tax=Neptunicella marina TaxID=2125989 RepID=A0A8J6IRQ2_9ALTE|nr:glutathione S-transferase N-terminal domain-containing protein [Neptunicella marina]MBC3765169.1 glutathione S-transferase N-terminal domain-containing protein [Neptunicella marina]
MLKLYGSTTSPYVRRLRMWLANVEHQFLNLQIFEGEDRELLARHNPAMKIPMIEDDGVMIYDSRVIFRYLSEKFHRQSLSWEQENILTLIDSANDSFVQLMLLKRSDIDTNEDKLYFRLQHERINATLTHLNQFIEQQALKLWGYPEICLYCLLDWVQFRQLHSLQGLHTLLDFMESHQNRIEVTATDPRQ